MDFQLHSHYSPQGDQPQAIAALENSLRAQNRFQTLLGVTGSGKTFTMANLIQKLQRPALIISHNKTLAAQLYGEFKNFFPENAVEYFVSYYDYYQPEAYIPQTDTFIEKDSAINEEIERLRLSATSALLSRRDVIVIASVSCIYGLGSPEDFREMMLEFKIGDRLPRQKVLEHLAEIQYARNDYEFKRGSFRVRGDTVDIFPSYMESAVRITWLGDEIENIQALDPISGKVFPFVGAPFDPNRPLTPTPSPSQQSGGENDAGLRPATQPLREEPSATQTGLKNQQTSPTLVGRHNPAVGDQTPKSSTKSGVDAEVHGMQPATRFLLFPSTSHVTPRAKLESAFKTIRVELDERVNELEKNGKLLEAQRIRMRTEYDLEMLREIGFCSGIENYSRHISGRLPGSRPDCLIDYLQKDTLVFIDESHVSWPQIGGMFNGDRARKERLVEYGFRLPSALDNRPMRPEEFLKSTGQIVFASATPAPYELENSAVVAEQVVRPTGLLDPEMIVRPITGQVEDLINEAVAAAAKGERILVTTLTKRMSEDLADYLRGRNLKVEYLHSDIDALERVEILRKLRLGEFDVLVGVNLLREGLDLPEVALVAILDADKEGFLRSTTSLIQTAGRAARHEKGRVILYADNMTKSLQATLEITQKRREKQIVYNKEHGITPKGIKRAIEQSMKQKKDADLETLGISEELGDVKAAIIDVEKEMLEAAERLDFERAAMLRDQLSKLKGEKIKIGKGKK
jgi:excinuclease ABC subunit B